MSGRCCAPALPLVWRVRVSVWVSGPIAVFRRLVGLWWLFWWVLVVMGVLRSRAAGMRKVHWGLPRIGWRRAARPGLCRRPLARRPRKTTPTRSDPNRLSACNLLAQCLLFNCTQLAKCWPHRQAQKVPLVRTYPTYQKASILLAKCWQKDGNTGPPPHRYRPARRHRPPRPGPHPRPHPPAPHSRQNDGPARRRAPRSRPRSIYARGAVLSKR